MGRRGMTATAGPGQPCKTVCAFLGTILLYLAAASLTGAQEVPVSRLVQEAGRGRADFFVVLREEPASAVLQEAKGIARRPDRRRFIVDQLKRRTFRSQNNLGYSAPSARAWPQE